MQPVELQIRQVVLSLVVIRSCVSMLKFLRTGLIIVKYLNRIDLVSVNVVEYRSIDLHISGILESHRRGQHKDNFKRARSRAMAAM
jgi:hypothetical protein